MLGIQPNPMFELNEEHRSFIIDRELHCYKAIPFDLKNAGATYQRLMNTMFKDLIRKTMEVYVDDMLVSAEITNEAQTA